MFTQTELKLIQQILIEYTIIVDGDGNLDDEEIAEIDELCDKVSKMIK